MSPTILEEPAGIYVHWPYCSQHCSYCSFTISTEESTRESYFRALRSEIEIVAEDARGAAFDAISFGGGTPSRLSPREVDTLLGDFRSRYSVLPGSEITLEANPEDVSTATITGWKSAGVTRVSLGVQSFHAGALEEIGRLHTADGARRAVGVSVRSGLDVSCDLILGLPEQTSESFLADVRDVAAAGVGHLSIYLLELDRAHRLAEDRRRNPHRYLSDDEQAALSLEASSTLRSLGFEHYEVSSWALPGRQARLNSKYWNRTATLGFGVAAHELWNGRRRANTTSLRLYLDRLEEGARPTATDQPVGEEEAARERIFLGARTSRGVAAPDLEAWLERHADPNLRADWEQWLRAGLVVRRENRYALSEEGLLLSSEVLCRFV
jgi:oxygen-independent coproporphyrinogen III oxidase